MFALGMMLLVAKYQRDRHVETWAASTRNAIERGVHVRVPYGYRRADGRGSALVPDDERADVVRGMYQARLRGEQVSTITHGLNDAAVPGPTGGSWTRQTVRALLRSRTYLGEASYGEHVQPDAHPALVSPTEWEQAQPNRGATWQSPGKTLLVGLVRCAGCGYSMGATSSRQGRRYSCGRHHSTGKCPSPTTAPAERLEALVAAAFLDRYGHVSASGASTADPHVGDCEAILARVQAEYMTWRDDVDMREALGDVEYRAGLFARKRASDDAIVELDDAVRSSSAATLTIDESVWTSATVPERRELLAAGVEAVMVSRAASTHSPLAGRVNVEWVGSDGTGDTGA